MKDAEEKTEERDLFGEAYDLGQKNYNLGVDGSDLYSKWYFKEKGQLRRNKIHKFSELTERKWNWKWNSAKVSKTTRSWARSGSKIAKRFGPWGLGLSGGMVVYEVGTDTWDAHTFVDGALIIVGVGLLIFGGWAVAGTVVAAYGVADYLFDLGGMWDSGVGRESGIWD